MECGTLFGLDSPIETERQLFLEVWLQFALNSFQEMRKICLPPFFSLFGKKTQQGQWQATTEVITNNKPMIKVMMMERRVNWDRASWVTSLNYFLFLKPPLFNTLTSGTQAEAAQASPRGDSPSKGGQSGGIIQTLTPVTIRQLYNATQQQPEDIFKVDGKELNQVTLVGQIVSSQIQSTTLELLIDDSTGKIDVKQWLEPDEGNGDAHRSQFKEGVYVRVVGHLRAFQQRRNIMAFRIQPIDDWNEITFHLLEAIHVHLFNTRGPLEGSGTVSLF